MTKNFKLLKLGNSDYEMNGSSIFSSTSSLGKENSLYNANTMKKYEEEKQKVEVLNNQLNEYEKQILYLKDHIKRIDQTKVTMDNKMQLDYKRLKENANKESAAANDAKNENAKYKERLATLERKNSESEKACNNATRQRDDALNKCNELSTANRELHNTISLNEQKIASINEFYSTRAKESKATIDTHSSQILQLSARCEKTEAKKAAIEAKLKDVKVLQGIRK